MINYRGQGQPWLYELQLKDALYPGEDPDDITEEQVKAACIEVHKRLMDFHDVANELKLYGRIPLKVIAGRFERLGKSELVDVGYFNHDLDILYDWADSNRVLIK
jgi:hypothetical protein